MRIIEVTGEYRPCPSCKLGFKGTYPRGTTYAVLKQWWGTVHVVPHKSDCPRGYLHRQALANELEQLRALRESHDEETTQELGEPSVEPS